MRRNETNLCLREGCSARTEARATRKPPTKTDSRKIARLGAILFPVASFSVLLTSYNMVGERAVN